MAVLSKIRQRTGLLIVVIGFCLLAFLVGDAFQSGTFDSGSNDIGSVNGTDIQTQEFLQKVSMSEKQGQGISNTQAINNTWEQEVRSIILSEEFKKLAQLCSTNVIVPADVKCCGFAGDRGFNFPELNDSALRYLKTQTNEAKMAFSTSKTCEIGLSEHSGLDYNSIFYLINKVTNAKI